jgi:hypothetical protein
MEKDKSTIIRWEAGKNQAEGGGGGPYLFHQISNAGQQFRVFLILTIQGELGERDEEDGALLLFVGGIEGGVEIVGENYVKLFRI